MTQAEDVEKKPAAPERRRTEMPRGRNQAPATRRTNAPSTRTAASRSGHNPEGLVTETISRIAISGGTFQCDSVYQHWLPNEKLVRLRLSLLPFVQIKRSARLGAFPSRWHPPVDRLTNFIPDQRLALESPGGQDCVRYSESKLREAHAWEFFLEGGTLQANAS